jgi:hypothetical protein
MNAAPHQVIYTHGAGRLGNQVIRFLHWMAWTRAQAGQVEVLNLAFWPFARFFEVWRDHPGCVFPVRDGREDDWARRRARLPGWLRRGLEQSNRLPRIVQAAGHWRSGWQAIDRDIRREETIDLDDPAFLATVTQQAVTTCSGWRIASWQLVAEHQAHLRRYFQPAAEYGRPAIEFIQRLRQDHDVVIGLFIRQSDYREWDDGRFYFSTPQYADWIRQLTPLYTEKRIAVMIVSEVKLEISDFAGLPCFFGTGEPNGTAPWLENWVELSLCDVIVSVPSTFSATAAFLGDVPL